MRAPTACAVVILQACAGRPGYVGTSEPDDVAKCPPEQPCGGSADPLAIGLPVSVLVGLALAYLWIER